MLFICFLPNIQSWTSYLQLSMGKQSWTEHLPWVVWPQATSSFSSAVVLNWKPGCGTYSQRPFLALNGLCLVSISWTSYFSTELLFAHDSSVCGFWNQPHYFIFKDAHWNVWIFPPDKGIYPSPHTQMLNSNWQSQSTSVSLAKL